MKKLNKLFEYRISFDYYYVWLLNIYIYNIYIYYLLDTNFFVAKSKK